MWLNNVDADGNLLRYVSIWDALNQNAFGQVFVNGEVKTGGVNHRVLAGLDIGTKEYIADWSQSHQLDSINGGFFNMNNPVYGRPVNGLPQFDRSQSLRQRANTSSITQSYSGFYLQDELGFFENALRLTLAGRYTYVNQNSYGAVDEDSRITPRVGLSYSINDQTSVYALYDQAFVPQTGVLKSGEPVKPITGNNMEFGAKREFFNGKWSTGLSLYRIFKNNQMVSDPENPTAQYSLLTQTTTQGVEFDARGEIIPGLIVTANYAYTDSEITDDERTGEFSQVGSPVPGFAKHVANGWLTYSIQSGVLEGLGEIGRAHV